MIVVGITGASGVIYGVRLIEALNDLNIENSLVISDAAKTVINHELERNVEDVINLTDNYYEFHDLTASINSGSFKFDSLAIVPCSMKTLSSIANGYGANTITRVADVALKEHRKTVIVPGLMIKIASLFSRFLPRKLCLQAIAHQQKKKLYKKI